MTTEAPELVLTPTEPARKQNLHVTIALHHMHLQREHLTAKIESLTKERDDLDASIAALDK